MSRPLEPPEDEAGDVLADKIRGVLVGTACGEALGAPVDGFTRDAILRRHGRVVHRLEGSAPGALAAAARAAAEGVDGGPTGPGTALVAAIVGAVVDGGPPAPGTEAEALAAVAAAHAFAAHPYQRLHARRLLEEMTRAARTKATRAALAQLVADAISPPSPDVAADPYLTLEAPIQAVVLTVHSLVVRPRSVEEAVVYAVNLGGEASLRGALAGALAGAHRGASGVPERWTADIDTGGLSRLALALAKKVRGREGSAPTPL